MLNLPVPLWMQAMLYGLLSAASLPVGAALGVLLSPIPPRVTARWMAFGSGALVFAVATQLYGQVLFKIINLAEAHPGCNNYHSKREDSQCKDLFDGLNLQICTGLAGSWLYVKLNHWLQKVATSEQYNALASPRPGAAAAASGRHSPRTQPLAPVDTSRNFSIEGGTASSPVSTVSTAACSSSWRRHGPGVGSTSPRSVARDPWAAGGAAGSNISGGNAVSGTAASATSCAPSYGGSSAAVAVAAAPGHASAGGSHSHKNVALSMWLGLMLDGIPESLMLGFMTNQREITLYFLTSIFIANFPEAFSGASMLRASGMKGRYILLMWTAVFVLTGCLAMVGSLAMPGGVAESSTLERNRDFLTAAMEGLTGGAMLAMVATAMLPEAFHGAGEEAGIFFVAGFVSSVFLGTLGSRYVPPSPKPKIMGGSPWPFV